MKLASLRLPALLSAALALGGCGGLTLKTFDIADQVDVPLVSELSGQNVVVYSMVDGFEKAPLPPVLSLQLQGNAEVLNGIGELTASVYVRPNLDTLLADSRCTMSGTVLICVGTDESTFSIGSIPAVNGTQKPFTLAGAPLETAAEQGEGYFGISIDEEQLLSGDALRLTDVKALVNL